MNHLSNKIEINYQFTSGASEIPKNRRKDPSIAYMIEGDLIIRINNRLYFKENLALLEFYLCLDDWFKNIKKKHKIIEFKYYTLEYEEDQPIIELLPFNDKARLKSIWEEEQVYNVFDLHYLVQQMKGLYYELGDAIQQHYQISI
ncbi:hypothetical protein LC087_13455 [Bacillus carboniphilus]|uniref:DUF7878 domain-containing protein n=1 Tax=Bacillus carboniphilus TaxID=86663 RepID=A0ABY9JR08_9BACI|nr:hypothetical protein [Bacillus carboniphilus]WLR41841.1 hypothetical protein LC087_13455 [Bacillus carboniphilus]